MLLWRLSCWQEKFSGKSFKRSSLFILLSLFSLLKTISFLDNLISLLPLWKLLPFYHLERERNQIASDVGGKFISAKAAQKSTNSITEWKKNVKDLNLDVIEFFEKKWFLFSGDKFMSDFFRKIRNQNRCVYKFSPKLDLRRGWRKEEGKGTSTWAVLRGISSHLNIDKIFHKLSLN